MKIVIEGVPRFRMIVPKPMIEALMLFSEHHYDGRCKDVGRVGGFVYGWNNMAEDCKTEVLVRASWQQLDITLKLCESPLSNSRAGMREMVADYVLSATYAMSRARDLKWEITVREDLYGHEGETSTGAGGQTQSSQATSPGHEPGLQPKEAQADEGAGASTDHD